MLCIRLERIVEYSVLGKLPNTLFVISVVLTLLYFKAMFNALTPSPQMTGYLTWVYTSS